MTPVACLNGHPYGVGAWRFASRTFTSAMFTVRRMCTGTWFFALDGAANDGAMRAGAVFTS